MLGRLFGNGASSANGAVYPRDSVVDEEYTRSLLYPEPIALKTGSPYLPPITTGRVGDFDDWRGLELDASRDFRVIVAQDALGDSEDPCVLFDTHPTRPCDSPLDSPLPMGILQSPMHRRGGSTASAVKSPMSPQFGKMHQRGSPAMPSSPFSSRNRSFTFSVAADDYSTRPARVLDTKEETKTILSCAFGSSAGAATGTKMHMLSLDAAIRDVQISPSSPAIAGSMSPGYFRKREPLTRAHTSTFAGTRSIAHERANSFTYRPKSTDAVLITKLFNVNLPEKADSQSSHPAESNSADDPKRKAPEITDPAVQGKGKKLRAKKTPMFAIILVIQLPTHSSAFSRPQSRGGMSTPPFAPSFRSLQNPPHAFTMSPQLSFLASLEDRGDPRVNALVEHWDIIDRTLSHLEHLSAPKILKHLQRVDDAVAAVVNKPSKPKEKTMQRTNQINIYLGPCVLSIDPVVKNAAVQATQRVQRAFRIPRVTTGQGRWGLWNDELIRTARVYGSKEQEIFILNLLTAFLATHTEDWMNLLPPSKSGRQHPLRSKSTASETMRHRTVIVCSDRSIARRLIFLLAAFLPGDDSMDREHGFRQGRGSCISLRNSNLRSPSRGVSKDAQRARSPAIGHLDRLDGAFEGLRISNGIQHKPADVNSIRSVPIPVNDHGARKSSAAMVSNMTPHQTTPVGQFTSGSGPETAYLPDSSSASASLNKIWRTANKDGVSSTASTKWGSLLSGFWSKDSSGALSDSTVPSASSSIRASHRPPSEAMARPSDGSGRSRFGSDSGHPHPVAQITIPKPVSAKLQVNADEGLIDVDIGLPGFLSSSGDSGLTSHFGPKLRHVSSVGSLDSLASLMPQLNPGPVVSQGRVAGFLPKFHPDFSLQAVRATKSELPELLEGIKGAMLAESQSYDSESSGWVDVSETLIANVHTSVIRRLCLKRKITTLNRRASLTNETGDANDNVDSRGRPVTRSSTNHSEYVVEEEAFSFQPTADLDPLLTKAVEKILARDGNPVTRSLSPAAASHSRNNSTGTFNNRGRSKRHLPLDDAFSQRGVSNKLPGSMIVGALGEVVRLVSQDISEERRVHSSNEFAEGSQRTVAQKDDIHANALRDGVRRWLLNGEQAVVW